MLFNAVRMDEYKEGDSASTLKARDAKQSATDIVVETRCFENHSQDARYRDMGDVAPTCHAQMGTGGNNVPLVMSGMTRPRRLTIIEIERLFGFQDNWTRIPWNGKPEEKCPESRRLEALGNSMCINCMEWIGRRIQMVEDRLASA